MNKRFYNYSKLFTAEAQRLKEKKLPEVLSDNYYPGYK